MKDRKVFIDTNVLIYTYSVDEPYKRNIAISLFNENNDMVVSIQVVNELVNVLSKKFHLAANDINIKIGEIVSNCKISNISLELINKALILKSKYKYSYFDCLILASALENDCEILCSEDMQHNQIIENKLKIINPFVEKL